MSTPQAKARARGFGAEYDVARLYHGVRVGNSKAVKVGEEWIEVHPTHRPDVLTPLYAIESKHWKRIPVWFIKLMKQTVTNTEACSVQKIPLARIVNRETREKFIVMRESDFLEMFVGKGG